MNPVVIFSLIIFCVTVQVWLALVALSALMPPVNTLTAIVWPEWQYAVCPERDATLFHIFVALSLLAQVIGIWVMRHRLKQSSFLRVILPFLAAELVWTALMLNASFKIIVYHDRPVLAQHALIVLMVLAVMSKIFWRELSIGMGKLYQKIMTVHLGSRADGLLCLGIVALLFIPDTEGVLARMFFVDQAHHFDSFLAPAWAYSKGCVLNIDIMTEYGIGVPVMMAWFAKIVGGFSYPHIFMFWMWGTIFYFVLCFLFLRHWLGSFGIAAAGVLLAVKFQMFHPGVMPFIFDMPSATVMRYCWDIVFFLLLLGHLRSLHKRYVFGAALCCGIQIFCMTTCGYCLVVALVTYVAAFMIVPHLRSLIVKKPVDMMWFLSSVMLVPVTAIVLLGMTQGKYVWTPQFAQNMQEFNGYFLSGFGLMPMYETLQHKEILAGFMGFFIPIAYMGTFLVIAGLVYCQKTKRQDLLAAVLSLYGMAMYHYYVARSAPTSYYVVCIPYVFILAFWLERALKVMEKKMRRPVLAVLLAVVAYALVTNHTYLDYPNLFNPSRNPMVDPLVVQPLADGRSYFNQLFSQVTEDQKLPLNSLGETDEGIKIEKDFKTDAGLKKYYEQESDFSKDAALIASLTKPSEPVALLSSFEMKILIQADRKPFFYYSPILIARPMRMRTFPNSTMYTSGHAQRTLQQLGSIKPQYIFMEKIYLQAPGVKNFKDASLASVLNYIFTNYEPSVQGRYLVAMKLKKMQGTI